MCDGSGQQLVPLGQSWITCDGGRGDSSVSMGTHLSFMCSVGGESPMRSAGQDQTNDDSKCEATSAHQPLSSACFSLRETEASPSAAGFDFNALTQT